MNYMWNESDSSVGVCIPIHIIKYREEYDDKVHQISIRAGKIFYTHGRWGYGPKIHIRSIENSLKKAHKLIQKKFTKDEYIIIGVSTHYKKERHPDGSSA